MKIAFFVHSVDAIGGTEIATGRLAESLQERGHQVTVLTTTPFSQICQFPLNDYANRIRIVRIPAWQRSTITYRRTLLAQARIQLPRLLRGFHILHLRGLRPEMVALSRIAQRNGIKTLCVPMASGNYGDAAHYSKRLSGTDFNWISALTEAMCGEIVSLGFPNDRIGVIPNGVDTKIFRPSPGTLSPHVLFVGQFRPEKRHALLIDAWIQVKAAYPHAQLTLIGEGPTRAEAERKATEHQLGIRFLSNTTAERIHGHLHQHGIFVLPGISEGMSNALLEAMSVGLAPVVAATPANCALISHEENGLTYRPDSAQALAEALIRVINDQALRERLGTAASQTVANRYNLSAITEQYLQLYTRLLGESS